MDDESRFSGIGYNKEPEAIGPRTYEDLNENQKEEIHKLLAQNPRMERAEALKIVLGSSEEEK